MLRTFRKYVQLTTLSCFLTMTYLVPATQSKALASTLTCDTAGPGCAQVDLPEGTAYYPTLQWDTVGSYQITGSGGNSQLAFLQGAAVDVNADTVAKALGVPSDQLASMVKTYSSNQPILFGRYDPIGRVLHVDVYRIVRTGNVSNLMHADFTPYMGKQWAAARYYEDSSAAASGAPGIDPLKAFQGGDDDFHNVGDVGSASALLGLAETNIRAPFALLVDLEPDVHAYTTTSGGLFRKTVTQHVEGRIVPAFYVLAPSGSLPVGAPAAHVPAFCAADPSLEGSGCPAYAVVAPGAVMFQGKGGSYDQGPGNWVQLYTKSQSGWSYFAVLIMATAFSVGGATILAGGAFSGSGLLGVLEGSTNLGLELSAAGNVIFEAAQIAALGYVVSGANGSGVYAFNPSIVMGSFPTKNLVDESRAAIYSQGAQGTYYAETEKALEQPARSEPITGGNQARTFVDETGDSTTYVAMPTGAYQTVQNSAPQASSYVQEQPVPLMQNNNGQVLLTVPNQ